ncbi:hypothetical protein VPH35_077432 [Triticum aestivum]
MATHGHSTSNNGYSHLGLISVSSIRIPRKIKKTTKKPPPKTRGNPLVFPLPPSPLPLSSPAANSSSGGRNSGFRRVSEGPDLTRG